MSNEARTRRIVSAVNSVRPVSALAWFPLVLVVLVTIPAVGQEFTYVTNSGTITITKYTGPGGDVSIPGTIDGLPVAAIAGRAFAARTNLISVMIPSSITNIGREPFSGSTDLTAINVDALNPAYTSETGVLFNKGKTVLAAYPCGRSEGYTVPNSVTIIADGAFAEARKLTNVVLPSNLVNIGGNAFFNCVKLPSVSIPEGVTTMSGYAFYACSSLASIQIPSSMSVIPLYAFASCTSLTNVALPNNLYKISEYAFYRCASLRSVSIPQNVTSVEQNAFGICTNLNQITVDDNNPFLSSADGVLFDNGLNTLIQCPSGKAGSYQIPSSVTNVAESAFAYSSLTNITIPLTVTSIGVQAFYSCRNLDFIVIPDRVVSTGNYAFGTCTKLTSVSIGSGLTNIGFSMFNNCSSLPCVTIPSTVITISDYAFAYCLSLTNVVIPDTVTSLGTFAFNNCSQLTNIIVGSGLTNISSSAFYLCLRLATVTIPSNILRIDARAFAYCYALRDIYFRGNAPVGDDSVFVGSPATIYYLPGTTGWGPTFGGRPTALWLPRVDTDPASFGIHNNQFGFTIKWASGMTNVTEACTNLAAPAWLPLSTNTITGDGTAQFSDPDWTNYPARFYRMRWP